MISFRQNLSISTFNVKLSDSLFALYKLFPIIDFFYLTQKLFRDLLLCLMQFLSDLKSNISPVRCDEKTKVYYFF